MYQVVIHVPGREPELSRFDYRTLRRARLVVAYYMNSGKYHSSTRYEIRRIASR